MLMMMMVVNPYHPFSTMTSSKYSVPSTVLNCELPFCRRGRHSLHLAENGKRTDLI